MGKQQLNILIYYGSVWGATEKICMVLSDKLCEIFSEDFDDVRVDLRKRLKGETEEEDALSKSDIVILSSSVLNNDFRFYIKKFARKYHERLSRYTTGLLLVNSPYEHRDHYLDQFIRQTKFQPDVARTTGGLVDVMQYREGKDVFKTYRDKRIKDFQGDIFGEINGDDLTEFAESIKRSYINGG